MLSVLWSSACRSIQICGGSSKGRSVGDQGSSIVGCAVGEIKSGDNDKLCEFIDCSFYSNHCIH